MYSNSNVEIYWDIPEYSGDEEELPHGPLRPDGKIVNITAKAILVLEMSIPWIENRLSKLLEKERKYETIVNNLRIENPGYNVKQLTFIMDCMGGYSQDLVDNLIQLDFTRKEVESLITGMQRIVVTEANSVINNFKMSVVS